VNRVHFVGKYSPIHLSFHINNKFLIRRQRKYKPTTSSYEVDLKSQKQIQIGHYQFLLLNTLESHVKFQLDIFTLEHNSLRVKINEINPIRKRYEVEHALVGEPKLVK
jgi:hypothetical protein